MSNINSSSPDAAYEAATQLHKAGRMDEAIERYRHAISLDPNRVGSHINLGIVLATLNRHVEAASAFRRATEIEPTSFAAHNYLGNALDRLGNGDGAVKAYMRAIELKPDSVDALYNLGNIHAREGNFAQAEDLFRHVLTLRPDFAKARYDLGLALCEMGRTEAGFVELSIAAKQTLACSPDNPKLGGEALHKVRHDREQRDHIAGGTAAADAPAINDLFRIDGGEKIACPAINLENASDAARQWENTKPRIVIIDNLLTDEALTELRRFCLGSTVWRKSYEDGYLGALPGFGFACPLLAQIAEELRSAFPSILRAHPLRYLWGFKYDSTMAGTNIHADEAAVNVNFWITPDEANLDPEHGGLVLWDVAAPLDWNYDRYNGDIEANRAFLARHKAKSITVPYRANRAVIFDSNLFHETDTIRFKDGYLNRRINITMLYGQRIPPESG